MRNHAILLGTVLLGLISALSYAQAPVPFINLPLIPDATQPGGPQFTLTVNGTGFVASSVINWNGSPLATQFVSGSQLTATVPAANTATVNTGSVTVVNPSGSSNVAFFATTPNRYRSLAFTQVDSPATGIQSQSEFVAVGDFNGDGKLDMAVVNCGSLGPCNSGNPGDVSVLLGDGRGGFTLASSTATGAGPLWVAVGDFNGDGKLDLATANGDNATVSILLGDGTGNFTVASSPATGQSPDSIAVGDFNGDGKLDLAVANYLSNTVSILLGDGTGNFTLASSPAAGTYPASIAAGDFNGDGNLDLAVANPFSGTVSILLGDGTGNFTLRSSPVVGAFPTSLAVGDFNGDGKLDLVITDGIDNKVSVLVGDGTGNFAVNAVLSMKSTPGPVAVGDFNGDGKLDLAIPDWYDGTVSVLLGDGTGEFTLGSQYATTNNGSGSLAVGDFNGDGKLDMAVANRAGDTVSIVLQGLYPAISVSPASLSFPAIQTIGTSSAPLPVTITNTGGATATLGTIVTGANFAQTTTCSSTLAPGGQCTVNVTFVPQSPGTHVGTVAVNDVTLTSPQIVRVSGVGTVVSLVPPSLNFGSVQLHTTAPPQTVTLTNLANTVLTISAIEIAITHEGQSFSQTNNCGASVPAAGSCTITVTFHPYFRPNVGRLDVIDSGGGNSGAGNMQVVPLTGTGIRPNNGYGNRQ